MTEKLFAGIDETRIFTDYKRIPPNSEHELTNSRSSTRDCDKCIVGAVTIVIESDEYSRS
jgi:hypothetical protein